MSKDTSGAQKRIEKALIHNLLSQSQMGHSKHAAKQAAREEWLGTHGDLKGWNPAKAEGIYSRGTMATYIGVASRFAGFAAECGAKRINDLTEQMGADYLCARTGAERVEHRHRRRGAQQGDGLAIVSGGAGPPQPP